MAELLGPSETLTLGTFVTFSMLALVITGILSVLKVPHQLIAMCIGASLGAMFNYMPFISSTGHFWAPNDILFSVHPIMIMKLVYFIDTHIFAKSIYQILLITFVGTGMFILSFGFLLIMFTAHKLHLNNIVMAGVTLAAIDVPDIILELNRVKNLEPIMDGESIFGSAFCLITYSLCMGNSEGLITAWYQIIFFYLRFILLSILTGVVIGKIVAQMYKRLYNDFHNAVSAIVSACYFGYIIAENVLYCSGAITTFVIAFCITQERNKISVEVDANVMRFLDVIYDSAELFNSIVLSVYVTLFLIPDFKGFDFAISLGVYVVGNVLRLLILLVLTPILSRMGYGFTFTHMFTVFWAAKRGSLQLLQVIYLHVEKVTDRTGSELLVFTLIYLCLTFLINVTTLKWILSKFGLIEFSKARKNNINTCINIIQQKGNRLVSFLKMNRFFSDANWPLVQKATTLSNPFAKEVDGYSATQKVNVKETSCPSCLYTVSIDPNKKELRDMIKEAKTRVLKAERISYMKQFENGLLSKVEMLALLQAIELAMDSKDLELRVSDVLYLFNTPNKILIWIKNILIKTKLDDFYAIPFKKLRRSCYVICTSNIFIFGMTAFIVADFIVNIIEISIISRYRVLCPWTMIIYTVLIAEFFIKILAYSHKSISQGIYSYFRNVWNVFDFFMILVTTVDFLKCATFITGGEEKFSHFFDQFYEELFFLKIMRVIRLCKLFMKFYSKLVTYIEKQLDERILYAFTIGKAMIIAYEDVLELLPQIVNNPVIQLEIKNKLNLDRMTVTKELIMVEKERPWITTTVVTKQALTTTLKSMMLSISDLKYAGFIDEFEYHKLITSMAERWTVLSTLKWLAPVSPKMLFYETPWLCEDESIADFLYSRVQIKIWEAGAIVCEQGEMVEGVYILVSGLFKIIYIPTSDCMDNMNQKGAIPIKEFLNNMRFAEEQEDYLMIGNSMGELCVLTERPYSCRVISDAPCQAFIIPSQVLKEAFTMNSDPVNGLIPRIWKHITMNMARCILERTPIYNTARFNFMNEALNRGFIPNLSSYKVLHVSELVEDLILVDGLLIDYNTQDVYTSPCYIPRSVQKCIIPLADLKATEKTVLTKLMIIPFKGVDKYEAMFSIQTNSDLIPFPPKETLVSEKYLSQRRQSQFFNMNVHSRLLKMRPSSKSMTHRTDSSRSDASSVDDNTEKSQ